MLADKQADAGKLETIGGLLSAIERVKASLVDQGLVRDKAEADHIRFWFRGQAKTTDWSLHPKGLRKSYDHMRAMLHEFRAEATILHDAPSDHHDLRQWLFLMQHYGMPTLLLDWTRSALAALAFALEVEPDRRKWDQQDGALWILRPGRWNQLSKATPTYAVAEAYSPGLNDLFAVHVDQDAGGRLSCSTSKSVTAIEPVFNSPRMIAQQGVFTIHGPASEPMEKVAPSLPEKCLWKLMVPSGQKTALRQELHDLGVRLSSLFPDLDHLSTCIRRRYGTDAPTSEAEKPPRGRTTCVEQNQRDDMGTGGAAPSDVTCE